MAQSVLGSLTLGYRPLWNRARGLAALQLFVHEDGSGVDGAHLLRTIAELWSAESPALLLDFSSRRLLGEVLESASGASPMLQVPADWLDDPACRAAVQQARQRGARLLVRGAPERLPRGEAARWFQRQSVGLAALDAAAALRASLQIRQAAAQGRVSQRSDDSPVRPDMLVDGVASRALAEHVLDQQGGWAVAGWPAEDVMHGYRGQPMPLSRRTLIQVMNALDEEQSLDRIEELFGQEPVLAYRLLVYLNSPGLGLPAGIASLRHGFMMVGFRRLNAWLAEQLPFASEDPNLRPINGAMVLRALVVEQLMDSGVEDDLRREVYLCGLLSQLDLVLDEPLRTSLSRLPLSERIVAATLGHGGPYAPALQVGCALERSDPAALRALRTTHELGTEEINRALLRALSGMR